MLLLPSLRLRAGRRREVVGARQEEDGRTGRSRNACAVASRRRRRRRRSEERAVGVQGCGAAMVEVDGMSLDSSCCPW